MNYVYVINMIHIIASNQIGSIGTKGFGQGLPNNISLSILNLSN
jgi:hypothetical protein